jgi:hypothetical protein
MRWLGGRGGLPLRVALERVPVVESLGELGRYIGQEWLDYGEKGASNLLAPAAVRQRPLIEVSQITHLVG